MTRVVLTADRTLMSEYQNNMFFGFSASFPKKFMPAPIYYRMFAPSVPVRQGRAVLAPYALRKIEAALLADGFSQDDVVVAHPFHLSRFVDRDTQVFAVSTMDPLGYGPVTSTFTNIYDNPAYVPGEFREVLSDPSVRKFRPKTIVGGPGSWQLDRYPGPRDELGIDCVVTGEGEITFPKLVHMVEKGEALPRSVEGEIVPTERIPNIANPTVNAMVEVARGCGRGCKFCTPTLLRFRCRSIQDILKEVEVNTRAGYKQIYIHAEDVWRYGAKGIRPDKGKVIELFKTIYNFDGVTKVFPSHGALASVACEKDLLPSVSEVLEMGEDNLNAYQTGVETGSPAVVERHMKGKVKPFKPEEWPEVVRQAFEISVDSHWIPCATMMVGLPGETDDDVVRSIELLDKVRDLMSGVFPLFFVAMGNMSGEGNFTKDGMTPLHWEFIVRCWEHNLRYIPYFVRHGGMENRFWNFVLERVLVPLGRAKLDGYADRMRSEMGEEIKKRLSAHSYAAPA